MEMNFTAYQSHTSCVFCHDRLCYVTHPLPQIRSIDHPVVYEPDRSIPAVMVSEYWLRGGWLRSSLLLRRRGSDRIERLSTYDNTVLQSSAHPRHHPNVGRNLVKLLGLIVCLGGYGKQKANQQLPQTYKEAIFFVGESDSNDAVKLVGVSSSHRVRRLLLWWTYQDSSRCNEDTSDHDEMC